MVCQQPLTNSEYNQYPVTLYETWKSSQTGSLYFQDITRYEGLVIHPHVRVPLFLRFALAFSVASLPLAFCISFTFSVASLSWPGFLLAFTLLPWALHLHVNRFALCIQKIFPKKQVCLYRIEMLSNAWRCKEKSAICKTKPYLPHVNSIVPRSVMPIDPKLWALEGHQNVETHIRTHAHIPMRL